MNRIKVGSDFSGVGAFDQALIRLGIDYETVFSCDMDKYARQTYIHNYGEPKYYPKNVYDREIPKEPLTIFMTSPPCQSFSLAGKRKGKDSENGILFFNSHEFIQQNQPRYFIFENVKGLLSDDNGKTFSEWCNMLGGKSINGMPVLFPYNNSVSYHIYHKVLNSKNYGVPQNRERVFIIGIRDDSDNNFTWPKEIPLEKRLKDVLEDEVDDKYFLSDKMLKFVLNTDFQEAKPIDINRNHAPCIKVGGDVPCFDILKIKSATKKGYETAKEGDSINFSVPNSETRRGRVGKGVAQTLDTQCNQAVIGAMRGRYKDDGSTEQQIELNNKDVTNTITSVQKDNLVITNKIRRLTPRECFRLQDFPDSFTWPVSDSQAYKQAGNSITVAVLYNIVKKLRTNNS